jgi:hypothetical protein
MIDCTLTSLGLAGLNVTPGVVAVVAGSAVLAPGEGDEGEVELGEVVWEEMFEAGGGELEVDRVNIPNPDRVRFGWGAFCLRLVVDDEGEEVDWRGFMGWSVVSRAEGLALWSYNS